METSEEGVGTSILKDNRDVINTKNEIQRYSKRKGPQWKTRTAYSNNSSQPIFEYGMILDIDSTSAVNRKLGAISKFGRSSYFI